MTKNFVLHTITCFEYFPGFEIWQPSSSNMKSELILLFALVIIKFRTKYIWNFDPISQQREAPKPYNYPNAFLWQNNLQHFTHTYNQFHCNSVTEAAWHKDKCWERLCSKSVHSTTSVLKIIDRKTKWSQNTAASLAFSNNSHQVRSCSVNCNKTTCIKNFSVTTNV